MEETKVKELFNNVDAGSIANNQLLIYVNGYIFFKSYNTKIGLYKNGEFWLTDKWDVSITTLKYVKVFINTFSDYKVKIKKDIEQLIKDNKIKLI